MDERQVERQRGDAEPTGEVADADLEQATGGYSGLTRVSEGTLSYLDDTDIVQNVRR